MTRRVALITGGMGGIGTAICRRLASTNGNAVVANCLPGYEHKDAWLDKVRAEGFDNVYAAEGDVANFESVGEMVKRIESDIGPIEVVVFNLGAQIGDRALKDTSYKAFEVGWRLATFALFRVASSVCPLMEERGKGTILVTSATAAVRGNAGQHSHAAAMGGRRMLCQTLNAEFSKKGIHVAHILIDGAVDAPDTLGKMLGPEGFAQLRTSRGKEHDGLLLPAEVAETYFHIAQQHRSAWTHEIDLRSFSDRPWWNH